MNEGGVSAAEVGDYEDDSDTNSDGSPEYYQPISSADVGDSAEDEGGDLLVSDYDFQLPNGLAENGVATLNLSEEDGEEEETAESERAIEIAFQEDERRRNAPLPPENSFRVIEAMRGVSFAGTVPEWAQQIPEDQWLNRLRGLRPSPAGSSGVTADSS